MRFIPDIRDSVVLDFGCGEGKLTTRIASQKPSRIDCIDNDKRMLDKARNNVDKNDGVTYNFLLNNESILPLNTEYDYIVCSLVLMMQSSLREVRDITSGIVESLKPSGMALFAVTHPCFREHKHSDFENCVPKNFSYCNSGTKYRVEIFDAAGRVRTSFEDFHWTLSDYMSVVNTSNYFISSIEEIGCSNNGGASDYLIYTIESTNSS